MEKREWLALVVQHVQPGPNRADSHLLGPFACHFAATCSERHPGLLAYVASSAYRKKPVRYCTLHARDSGAGYFYPTGVREEPALGSVDQTRRPQANCCRAEMQASQNGNQLVLDQMTLVWSREPSADPAPPKKPLARASTTMPDAQCVVHLEPS
jgi:hypothetical protein